MLHYNFMESRFNIYSNIYNGIIFPSLTHAKIFESIPAETRSTSSSEVGQITWLIHQMMREFGTYNFSRRILERALVGSIVNIRNECLFFWVHVGMNRSAEQSNRFAVHAIYLSCAPVHFPWTQKKRYSFLN